MRNKKWKTMAGKSIGSLAAIAALLATMAVSAQAEMQIDSFTTTTSTTQAGGHPDLTTSFTLHNPGIPESARNVIFEAPKGLFGNPSAPFRCTAEDFAFQQCPSNSQIGIATIRANYGGNPNDLLGTAPIFDLVPGEDQTGLFALIVPGLGIPIQIPIAVRTGSDYGLRFTVSELTQLAPLAQADLTFWGFPSSPTHSPQRFPKGAPGEPAGCLNLADTSCMLGVDASNAKRPLTDNPTTCTGAPLRTTLTVKTYQDPTHPTTEEASYPETEGCEKESFKPVLFTNLTTEETDSASGFDVKLKAPQFLGEAPAPSQLRSAVITLPPELTINPDAADGQTSCSDAQANFGSEGAAACPDGAKIGTFAVSTPALEEELVGSIYIGEPRPGEQYRLFLVANGAGVHAKLTGVFRPDPQTGQLTVELLDLPQAPFEVFQLHLFASDRGLLATPTHCTLGAISAHFTPWNSALPPIDAGDFIELNSGPHGAACPGLARPFHPRLEAGTSNPVAGAFSAFHLKLDRDDGDQFLGDLNFRMPAGFTGDLRGIPYCSEASISAAVANLGRTEQASPSCPRSSQIGTTNVAAGPGEHPFHAVGRMYLSGPFKGAPLSLVAITPALAGPYDYGTVVIRVALNVDPLTAQVNAVSETVPSIIGGIPIRMRSIQVNIDREHFTINPTNCTPTTVDTQGIGDQGTVTDFSSYFDAVNCLTLPFKPTMTVRQLGGRKQARRSANPSIAFDLNTRAGDANIKSLSVTLSTAFEIDQEHLGNICTEKELVATQCAGRQQIGEATTTTPLLDQPLSGPVYAVSGSGGLPRLAFLLNGQVDLLPRADTKTVKDGRLSTTVPVVPDAPIGHFHLVISGGKQGYLANTRNLCRQTPVVKITFAAQNGKARSESLKVKTPCGKSTTRHKRHRG
jgi:hypothetical protein